MQGPQPGRHWRVKQDATVGNVFQGEFNNNTVPGTGPMNNLPVCGMFRISELPLRHREIPKLTIDDLWRGSH
jgi:hypothetical protein